MVRPYKPNNTFARRKQGQGSSNTQSPQRVAKAISLLWVSQLKLGFFTKLLLFTHFLKAFGFDFFWPGMGPGGAPF